MRTSAISHASRRHHYRILLGLALAQHSPSFVSSSRSSLRDIPSPAPPSPSRTLSLPHFHALPRTRCLPCFVFPLLTLCPRLPCSSPRASSLSPTQFHLRLHTITIFSRIVPFPLCFFKISFRVVLMSFHSSSSSSSSFLHGLCWCHRRRPSRLQACEAWTHTVSCGPKPFVLLLLLLSYRIL